MLIVALLLLAAYVLVKRQDVVSAALNDDGDLMPHPDDTPPSGSTVDGYVAGTRTQIEVQSIDGAGHVLRTDAAEAFELMRDAAEADGVTLQVNSAWRSNTQQSYLYSLFKAGTGNLAAPPGFSNHQSGIDVDIESGGGKNDASKWLAANAERFGFKRTVSSEPWHYEYFEG